MATPRSHSNGKDRKRTREPEPAIIQNGSDEPIEIEALTIPEARLETAQISIAGIAPLCVHRFSQKARNQMERTMREGGNSAGRRAKIRDPRNFEADFEAAKYISEDGWLGIAASSFRNSLISACRLGGIPMTRAKLALFVEADGFDREDGTPLVRIYSKEPPFQKIDPVRNSGPKGVADLRARPVWKPGWTAIVSLTWDAQQLKKGDVFNLMSRAGMQVGVGEGRPDSRQSNGIGYGRWRIDSGVAQVVTRRAH